jgi:RNA polymerase sigma factor (TIGR02999 family)
MVTSLGCVIVALTPVHGFVPKTRIDSGGNSRGILSAEIPPVESGSRDRVTEIVAGLTAGSGVDSASAEQLWPAVYDELRRLAQWQMGGDARGHTLQPTALVHEAYLRLVDQSRVDFNGRTHFIAFASKVMRNLLIDHARRRASAKRGGELHRVTLVDGAAPGEGGELDLDQLLSLDAALERLAEHDERQARVVELRYFGGLKVDEVAEALGVSKRTVEGYWTHARAWLLRELTRGDAP